MEYLVKGCFPDEVDIRDKVYNSQSQTLTQNDIDLRDDCMPDIYNQLNLGSCSANASLACKEYLKNRWHKLAVGSVNSPIFAKEECSSSRLFLYYMTRYIMEQDYHDRFLNADSGANLRSVLKALKKFGLAPENEFPYNIAKFTQEPTFNMLAGADDNKILGYYRILTFEDLLDNLYNHRPVIISTDVEQFLDVDGTGRSKKALTWDKKFGCNHAVLICGYLRKFDYYGDPRDILIVRNSWSDTWGDKGYCYLPADLMWRYNIYDAWTIVEDKNSFYQDQEGNSSVLQKIPNNTLIYDTHAFSKIYLDGLFNKSADKTEYKEITKVLNDNIQSVILKDTTGKIRFLMGNGDPQQEMVIGYPINYYDEKGEIQVIY